MRDFFRGWRWKLGIVTLVMACVFAVGWVRSLSDPDVLIDGVGSTKGFVSMTSFDGDFGIVFFIPYWSIVLPLTLLSACLLLSKRPPVKRSEAAQGEGIA